MNDRTRISSTSSRPAIAPTRTEPGGYQGARDIKARLNVMRRIEAPDIRAALERLRQILASGEPLRTDVPRGYYLNILV